MVSDRPDICEKSERTGKPSPTQWPRGAVVVSTILRIFVLLTGGESPALWVRELGACKIRARDVLFVSAERGFLLIEASPERRKGSLEVAKLGTPRAPDEIRTT